MFHRISPSQDQEISLMTFSSFLRVSFLGQYYIGLNDLNDTGTYKWADGTAASFTNWNTGHPTRGKGGVVMKMDKKLREMGDEELQRCQEVYL